MSGAAFLRIKKLKGGGIITVAARHNRRVIQAEIGASGSIDPTRSHLNETLRGSATADAVGQLAKDLMAAAGVGKLRKGTGRNSAVIGIEVVFSLPPDHKLDDRAYFLDCCAWTTIWFEGAPILSADIHRDEAAPHCHVLLLPLIDGRMDGSNLVGNKPKFLKMQKDFHDKVASKYGLRKAPARLSGPAKQSASAAVIKRLRETGDTALKSAAWATIRDKIENDPAPFLMAMGIVVEAPAKELRTMAQIFTSTGKGGKTEKPSPIGQAKRPAAKPLPLSCVGQAFQSTPKAPPELVESITDSPALSMAIEVRVRDCDQPVDRFHDGDYYPQPSPPARRQRQAADAWTRSALESVNK